MPPKSFYCYLTKKQYQECNLIFDKYFKNKIIVNLKNYLEGYYHDNFLINGTKCIGDIESFELFQEMKFSNSKVKKTSHKVYKAAIFIDSRNFVLFLNNRFLILTDSYKNVFKDHIRIYSQRRVIANYVAKYNKNDLVIINVYLVSDLSEIENKESSKYQIMNTKEADLFFLNQSIEEKIYHAIIADRRKK